MPELVGNVRVMRRRNKDKSWTFYLRWLVVGDEKEHLKRLFRTEADVLKPALRRWHHQARLEAYDVQDFYTADRPRRALRTAISDAMELYLQWIGGDKFHHAQKAALTISSAETTLVRFLHFLGDYFPNTRSCQQLSSKHINGVGGEDEDGQPLPLGYRYWRQYSSRAQDGKEPLKDSTIVTELSYISSFLSWCADPTRGYVMMNPFVFRRPKIRGKRTWVPSTVRIVQAIEVQESLLQKVTLRILAATGIRQGELRHLHISAWSPTTGLLVIPEGEKERTKQHARTLAISGETARMLAEHVGERTTGYLIERKGCKLTSQINTWLRPLELTPHDLRRWARTELERAGAQPYAIQDILGHEKGKIRRAYTPELSEDVARRWLGELEALLS